MLRDPWMPSYAVVNRRLGNVMTIEREDRRILRILVVSTNFEYKIQ